MLFSPGEIKLSSKFQPVKENLTPHAECLEASRLFRVTQAKLCLYFQQISSKNTRALKYIDFLKRFQQKERSL